jgi:hypothetical protein
MPCVVQSAPRGQFRQKSNVRSFSPVLCASNNIWRDSMDYDCIGEMRCSAQTMAEAAMYKEA